MAKGQKVMRWRRCSKTCGQCAQSFRGRKADDFEQGFSLVEVLVSMLIAAIFVSITMQAILAAAVFRARGDEYDTAVSWIQEDHEKVIQQAIQYESAVVPYSSQCGATNAANGVAAGFLADAVHGLGGQSVTMGPRKMGGKTYILSREGDFANSSDPFRLLQLTYTVLPQGGGPPIATVSTEVIPQAVFNCPSS